MENPHDNASPGFFPYQFAVITSFRVSLERGMDAVRRGSSC